MLKPPNESMSGSGDDERPIGEIVGRLIDEGKDYARAELGLVRATAMVKAEGYKLPAILFGVAILVAQAAVAVLAFTLFLGLAPWIGTVLAGLLTGAIVLGVAGLLVWLAVRKLRTL